MKWIQIRSAVLGAALMVFVFTALAGAPQSNTKQPASATKAEVEKGTPSKGEAATAAEHHHHGAAEKTAAKGKGKPAEGVYKTIVGEVMDPACFLEAGTKSIGPGHYQCAINCMRSGQTLAIYCRDEDRIYFIAGELPGQDPNVPLMNYIHKKVDVSGTVYHRSDAYGIVITKVVLHEEKTGKAEKATAKDAAPAAEASGKAGAGAPGGN